MAHTLTIAPDEEPLTLAEAKDHLRVDITDDDFNIELYLTAARETLEEWAHRAFVTQTCRLFLDRFPKGYEILLPRPPLQSVTHIKYYDTDNIPTTWAAANYFVDTDSDPGRVILAYNVSWPTTTLRPASGVEIEYVAGYGGPQTVPRTWKQAILLTLGHWYENRESTVGGTIIREVPMAVKSLVMLRRNFI